MARPDDIPQDVWDAAARALYVTGFPGGDLPSLVLEHDIHVIAARAISDERKLWTNVDMPVWDAEIDVMRAALRVAEYVLDNDQGHTTSEHEQALRVVREAIARKPVVAPIRASNTNFRSVPVIGEIG